MNQVDIWDFRVFSDSLNKISINDSFRKLLFTISPNSYGLSTKNKTFRKALMSADYLVLDGVYFSLASLLYKRRNIKRNQGPKILYHFMQRINDEKGKVFFLGSTQKTLNRIKKRAAIDFPNSIVKGYSPSFSNRFEDNENAFIIKQINKEKPEVLFIGLTAPKQEIWAYKNIQKLNVNLICCIGGVFDWYAGNYKEISNFWWKVRLGWLIRYIQRPGIILRDTKNDLVFFKHLITKSFIR